MSLFTAIGANIAEAAKPAFEIIDKRVTDKDLANQLKTDLESAYNDKNFQLKLALAQGNDIQRLIEPMKEITKIIIIAFIFIVFPIAEALFQIHIDIAKYLESMPLIGWLVLVAADLGPTITNKLLDYNLQKKIK